MFKNKAKRYDLMNNEMKRIDNFIDTVKDGEDIQIKVDLERRGFFEVLMCEFITKLKRRRDQCTTSGINLISVRAIVTDERGFRMKNPKVENVADYIRERCKEQSIPLEMVFIGYDVDEYR